MSDIQQLLGIMSRLRDPGHGCPWDLEQSFATIAPYTIEEAYEVADAIEREDLAGLCDELGDLLLQVVFHAQIASERGAFDFADVVAAICAKLVRRHPHVFSDGDAADAATVAANWESIKRQERAASADADDSALAGIAAGLPEWLRAAKLQARAARTGFAWSDPVMVLAKLDEEIGEVREELARAPLADNHARLQDEIGDLLFVSVALASRVGVDPGAALRHANRKFERRFRAMERAAAADGSTLASLSLAQQECYWQHAKRAERASQ